jgi:acyl carrier protein
MDMTDTTQPTFEQVALIIGEKLRIPPERIRPETALKDVDMDSLAMLEVLLAAENQFGAEIPDEEFSPGGTAEDLYRLILTAVDGSRA